MKSLRKAKSETEPIVMVPIYLKSSTVEYFRRMELDGGWRNRSALYRSLLEAIEADDRAAEAA